MVSKQIQQSIDGVSKMLDKSDMKAIGIINMLPPFSKTDPMVLRVCTEYDNSLVYIAIMDNDNIALLHLIAYCSINVINSRSQNLFHYAVMYGTKELVCMLLSRIDFDKYDSRISLNHRDKFGNSPLDLSLSIGRYDVSVNLCEASTCRYDMSDEIFEERKLMDSKIIAESLIKYPTIDWIDLIIKHRLLSALMMDGCFNEKGFNILHILMLKCDQRAVRKIVLYGVNIYCKTLNNISPISIAEKNHSFETIQLFRNINQKKQNEFYTTSQVTNK